MKKIRFSMICLVIQTTLCFSAFPVFAAESTKQPIPEDQIQRLNKAVEMIQDYYIQKVDEKTLMDNAINGMITKLDPHSAYLNKEDVRDLQTTVSGEFVGIGVELTTDRGLLKVVSPIEGSPAEKAGLKPEDLIIKINNHLVQDMSLNEAINQIKGKPNTTLSLTVLRKNNDKPKTIKVTREVVKVKAVQSKLLAPGYGYIRISLFQGPVAAQVEKAVTQLKKESNNQLKGLVLDLRNNPGGLLDVSAEVLNLFLDKASTEKYHNLAVYTKGRIPSADLKYTINDKDMISAVPMVVLINGGSASASEIVAGALQDYKRAIVMGTRSFGKGSVQTIIPISEDNAIKLTTALYYTPSGREIQARGITPDVVVPTLAIDDKKDTNAIDFGEASYGNHIANHNNAKDSAKSDNTDPASQQQSMLTLAKEDYQLYQALTVLEGMHASR